MSWRKLIPVVLVLGAVGALAIYRAVREASFADMAHRRGNNLLYNALPEDLQKTPSYYVDLRRRLYQAVLSTDVRAMRRPIIAVCGDWVGPQGDKFFMLNWIEAQPTVDEVQFLAPGGTAVLSHHLTAEEDDANRSLAVNGIVFTAMVPLGPKDAALDEQPLRSQLVAVLLRNGRRISDPVSVMRLPPTVTPSSAPVSGIFGNSIGMQFAHIPAGLFMMGSPVTEKLRIEDERQHRVNITRPFLLAVHETTVAEFARFVNDTGYQTDAEKGGWAIGWVDKIEGTVKGASWRKPTIEQTPDDPVVCVSWNDAVAFCQWLSRKEGRKYRLLTEAEWEYACRAGTTSAYPWANDANGGSGWCNAADQTAKRERPLKVVFSWSDGYAFTSPVGIFRANPWGLHDMIGNANEWCADRYAEYPDNEVTDPAGPMQGSLRILRGGSWYSGPRTSRAAFRDRLAPTGCNFFSGFRVALDSE